MSVIYIKEQGAFVRKTGERIEVMKNNQKLLSFPVANIDVVSVIGNVQISTQALVYMMQNGIDVSIFTYAGQFVGQARADASKNIFLRFAQFDRYQDIESRLNMARVIVGNKIENQMAVVRNYRYKDGFSPEGGVNRMKEMQKRDSFLCEVF